MTLKKWINNGRRGREQGMGGINMTTMIKRNSSSWSSLSDINRNNQTEQNIKYSDFVVNKRTYDEVQNSQDFLLRRKLYRELCVGYKTAKPGERQLVPFAKYIEKHEFVVIQNPAVTDNGRLIVIRDNFSHGEQRKAKHARENMIQFFNTVKAYNEIVAQYKNKNSENSDNSNNQNNNNNNNFTGKGGYQGGEDKRSLWQKYNLVTAVLGCFLMAISYLWVGQVEKENNDFEEKEKAIVQKDYEIENWSGTKRVIVESFSQPETVKMLEAIVKYADLRARKIRPVGAALSPNGVAFEKKGMVSLALLDKVLSIDEELKQVTVQPGARVSDVTEALRKYNLTLQNYASIREQQIGGFTQVGAHGTGAKIPPVDDTIVKMKLITPKKGTIELTKAATVVGDEGKINLEFEAAKVGLGCLGIASEITLQCVDAYKLKEETFTTTPEEVERNHESWIRKYKHVRYMWIPHTDCVVVVGSNPIEENTQNGNNSGLISSVLSYLTHPNDLKQNKYRTKPMLSLLYELDKEAAEKAKLENAGFGELRDLLLKIAPLDVEHVKKVNKAEAEFWKRSHGTRVDWSDQILGFDCGGQQHVLEVAFPCGSLKSDDDVVVDDVRNKIGETTTTTTTNNNNSSNNNNDDNLRKDLQFMRELRSMIAEKNIPAHAPIEQRWTSGSSSLMSPAFGEKDSLHSWVGIIMYLPTDNENERSLITERFKEYGEQMRDQLADRYLLKTHWAKIELETDDSNSMNQLKKRKKQIERLRVAYGDNFIKFRDIRRSFDPKGVLMNDLIEGLFEK